MKKLTRLCSVLLVCLLVINLFAGCGTSKPVDTPAPSDPTGEPAAVPEKGAEVTAAGQKVEFWCDKALEPVLLDKLQTTWTTASGYEVTIGNYQDPASYQTATQQSIDQADGPNLMTWWSGSQLETLAKNGKIADLTEQWPSYIEAGVSPDIQDAFTIDGKVYAAPYSILYNSCVYNSAAFAKAGIAQPPTTFDEFLEACEKLKAAGITPMGVKNDSWASFIWFQQFVGAYSPQLYLDICSGAKDYTDPEMVKVMEIWKDMIDKGYFGEPIFYQDMYRSFAQEEIAIMLEPNTVFTSLQNEFGMDLATDVSSFAMPSANGEKNVIFFEATPIVVPSANANVADSIKALESFFSAETQQALVDEAGIVNTSKTTLANPAIETLINNANDAENNRLILRFYENTHEEIRNKAIDELSRFMYSNAEIDEVLGNIQEKANEIWGK